MAQHPKDQPRAESIRVLGDLYRRGQITRRDFLQRSGMLAVPLAVPAAAAFRAAPAAAQQGGVLRISYGEEVLSLDKPTVGTADAAYMALNLFANMIRLDAEAQIIPDFAEG